jgi:simple sugar transport system permease protein
VSRWTSPQKVGLAGIALGGLAFWLALPPLAARTAALPLLIGLLAIFAGIWAASRGAVRNGGTAIAAGVLGIVLGVLATRSSSAHLDSVVVWGALGAATLRYATPLTFAAIGGLYCERSGVINVALEGMLLTGAFFGIWGAIWAHTWAGGLAWVVGLAAAALAGMALATVHAVWAISFKTDQIISGTALNFLALGITGYLFVDKYGETGTPGNVPDYGIPDIHLHFLQNWTLIGPIFGQLNLMIWLSLALLVATCVFLFRMPSGLRFRYIAGTLFQALPYLLTLIAVGGLVGISVSRVRYIAVIASGGIAAMGGAYLSLGFVHSFNQGMTNGIGFIGLAALIFGKWRPFPAWGAALLFGFSSALADRLPAAYGNQWGTLFQALPYLLTLIAVGGLVGRSIGPAAAGRPYAKQ